jgi:class 3 adenylate cyclase
VAPRARGRDTSSVLVRSIAHAEDHEHVGNDTGMTDGPDAEQRLALIAYLKSVGFTDEQIAANDDSLINLAGRRVLFGDEKRVTVAEIAALAGCDEALVRRVRLASGLPDVGDDAVCSPREAEVMTSFLLGAAVFGEEVTLQFLRVVGAATAGVAEAALATFASNRRAPMVEGGADLVDIARAGTEATTALLAVPPVLDVLLLVHFQNASTGRFAGADPSPMVEVAVGFVDLVQSTELTLSLSGEALAVELSDFEGHASDVVVGAGGRIVKRIGDAVMFVTSDSQAACAAASSIVDAVAAHPQLSTARGAVTWGHVLPRDGDYFGAAVNLAARAVALAEPGTIVVDAVVAGNLDSDIWLATALGEQSLKGFDEPVALFRLHPGRPDGS